MILPESSKALTWTDFKFFQAQVLRRGPGRLGPRPYFWAGWGVRLWASWFQAGTSGPHPDIPGVPRPNWRKHHHDHRRLFGLLKRGGRVYTKIIIDASSKTLIPIIKRKVVPDSIVYWDCWKAYNVLDVSDFKHFRINHSKLIADKKNHINGIENFWNQAKRHMRKFNGVPKAQYGLYLKECE